uniref:Uncharacterized protein n=1 Tax=Aegilops tauschii TaxID=37682 RepID=N1QTI1_AEGTA
MGSSFEDLDARNPTAKLPSQVHVPSPAAAPAGPRTTQDDVAEFFATTEKALAAPTLGDAAAALLDEEIATAIRTPLEFHDRDKPETSKAAPRMSDVFGPTLSGPRHAPEHFSCQTPSRANTVALQLGVVTQQGDIGSPPPTSERAPSCPNLQGACGAAQRSSLRLVQGLGLLGPKEKMTKKAAEALIRKFDEPLSDDDIAIISKLTNMDNGALRIAAGLISPDGVAGEAAV